MFSRRFLTDAAERAIRAFFAALGGTLTATALSDLSATWKQMLLGAGVSALVSLCFSLGAYTQKDSISPASLVPPT
jgi:hypothetical protein